MADFWSDVTGGKAHSGSWFGLPDFGATEAAQSGVNTAFLLPQNQIGSTGQQGSNLVNFGSNASSGEVAGAQSPTYSTQTSTPVNWNNVNTGTNTNTYSSNPTSGNTTTVTSNTGGQTQTSGNDSMMAYFDQAAGQLGQTQQNLEAQVNNLFGGSQNTINSALTGSLADLGAAKTKVEANTATSLRDLGKSMRNQLEAGAQKLGGIPGAANSTGANMYNYALGKIGNQNRADVMKQANELKSNIDLQVNKVKQTAQDQLSQLETWKNNQLLQISQYIQQQRGMIDQAKAQQIYSQLQNIDTQANQFKQSLYTWAMNNSTTLDQLKQKLAGFSQGNPTEVAQSGFPLLEFGPTTGNAGDQQVGLWNKKTPGKPQYSA